MTKTDRARIVPLHGASSAEKSTLSRAMHELGPYDFELGTTSRAPAEAAAAVVQRWRERSATVL
ncbi:MAG TPA: hypothetical protein VHP33_23820 [Polyangiaceae bacterium]|nr:hypothetical protein [Polyangiaceae bacterium]